MHILPWRATALGRVPLRRYSLRCVSQAAVTAPLTCWNFAARSKDAFPDDLAVLQPQTCICFGPLARTGTMALPYPFSPFPDLP